MVCFLQCRITTPYRHMAYILINKMKQVNEVIEVLDGNGVPNIEWVKRRLIEALS